VSVETIGAVTASSLGTTITADGSADTKGSYGELSAATSRDNDGFVLFMGTANDGADYLTDIATGAAASETVVLANVAFSHAADIRRIAVVSCPLAIATGTRVAAATQSSVGGAVIRLVLGLWQLGSVLLGGCTNIDTYGAETSDTGGVAVDPGASTNTKGDYAEITSSTGAATEQVAVQTGNRENTVRSTASWLMDLATGAAMSETVVWANFPLGSSTIADVVSPVVTPFVPLVIATSTRIAARAQCSINDATDRLFDALVLAARGADASGGSGGGGLRLVGQGGLVG
jgi:hypothetical protein